MTLNSKDRALPYFDHVRAQNSAAVGAMFANDGLLILPNGALFTGPVEISAAYDAIFAHAPAMPQVTATICEGQSCLVEIDAHQPDGSVRKAADVFDFDDKGQIIRLAIYMRS